MSSAPIFAVPDEAIFAGPPQSQTQGETHHGAGLFPPPPTTFQAVVRTHLLRRRWPDRLGDPRAVAEVVGPPEALPRGWQLLGPWPAGVRRGVPEEELELWLPQPQAVVREERSAGPAALSWMELWRPGPETLLDREAPEALLVSPGKASPGWIPAEALLALLRGEPARAATGALPPFVRAETRVGLALDDSRRTVERSMLYFREAHRFGGGDYERAGLYAVLDGAPAELTPTLQSGVAALGRRSRALTLQVPPPPSEAWGVIESGAHLRDLALDRFVDGLEAWLVLGTPAAFGGGLGAGPEGGPDNARGEPWEGRPTAPRFASYGACQVEVVAAALGRPVAIGGLRVGGLPKRVRAWVPAGSTWRIRLRGGSPEDRRNTLLHLHHRPSLGAPEERGFGCGHTWASVPFEVTP